MTYFIRTRWLLLLLFPIGFLLTQEEFTDYWSYYAGLNVLSFLSGWAILFRLRGITVRNVIIWIIFTALIVGYYMKFYFFVYEVTIGQPLFASDLTMAGRYATRIATNEILFECFEVISISFVAFGVVTFCLLHNERGEQRELRFSQPLSGLRGSVRSHNILISALLIAVFSGFFRWFFQLGIPGRMEILPFKIAGIITVTGTYTVPVLIGIALIYACMSGVMKDVQITIGIFLIWGLIHFLMFGSKLFLVFPILWIVLIGVLIGKPIMKWRYLFGFFGLFVLVFPYLNLFRQLSYIGADDNLIARLSDVIQIGSESFELSSQSSPVIWGVFGLVSRITGLDALMVMTALRPEYDHNGILSYMSGNEENAERIITSFYGIEGTGVAQSLLGQAYFVTGSVFWVAVWVAGWTLFTFLVAKVLGKYDTPIAQGLWVAWLISVLQWTTDGVSYVKVIFFVISIIPVILLVRFFDLGGTKRKSFVTGSTAQG